VPLSVIGAGFGRTGTTSLKQALEILGYRPCHHMIEVERDVRQLAYWQAAVAGNLVDWNAVFAGYRAAVDWPACHYWRELAAVWPDAKVILTERPEEQWWNSFCNTIKLGMDMRDHLPDRYARAVHVMAHTMIADQEFHAPLHNRQAAIAAYRRRSAEVRAAIPRERLLIFRIAEGWAPLCRFLGVAEPMEPFPHKNSSFSYWQRDRTAR
jgi:hypothetical protein